MFHRWRWTRRKGGEGEWRRNKETLANMPCASWWQLLERVWTQVPCWSCRRPFLILGPHAKGLNGHRWVLYQLQYFVPPTNQHYHHHQQTTCCITNFIYFNILKLPKFLFYFVYLPQIPNTLSSSKEKTFSWFCNPLNMKKIGVAGNLLGPYNFEVLTKITEYPTRSNASN